eukprot:12519801-Heterocapsa_arctica.AAC.1
MKCRAQKRGGCKGWCLAKAPEAVADGRTGRGGNSGRAGRNPGGWRCRESTGPLGWSRRARRKLRGGACGGERAGPRRGQRGCCQAPEAGAGRGQ